MKLIADSGSTKTDWLLIDNSTLVREFTTKGINPKIHSFKELRSRIECVVTSVKQPSIIRQIDFYGAGCSDLESKQRIKQELERVFVNAEIIVNHDLLGAALAFHQLEDRIVCILGTGSNCCVYKGRELHLYTPSLGFLLGDEGSGNHIGKELLSAYFRNQLSKNICDSIVSKNNLDSEQILTELYTTKSPNSFLASYSTVCSEHIENTVIRELVTHSFDRYIKNHIMKIPKELRSLPICFVGSIAHVFQELLSERLNKVELSIEQIIRKPIKGLFRYHLTLSD